MDNTQEKKTGFIKAVKLNFGYLAEVWRDDKKYVTVSALTTVINSLFPLVNIILPKLVIDAIQYSGDMNYIIVLIAALWGLNLLSGLYNSFINSQYLGLRGSMSAMKFLTKISSKASELDLSQVERKETTDKMEMARQVIYNGIHNDAISSAVEIVSSIIMIATTVGIVATASWWLVLAIVLVSVVCTFIDFRIEKDNVEVQRENQKSMTKMNYYTGLLEGKGFTKEIRLYDLGRWIESKCDEMMSQINKNLTAKNRKWGGWRAFESAVSITLNYGAYLFLAILAFLEKITIGNFTMYFSSISTFRSNFTNCISILTKFGINAEYIEAYNDFMSMESEIAKTTDTSDGESGEKSYEKPVVSSAPALRFENVDFRYSPERELVLRGVNLTLKPNEIYAVVGENGAGKTTLINLICRFYDPTSGVITLDGEDIKHIPVRSYRAEFSAIFQGFSNISFSISDNISLDRDFDGTKAENLMESLGMNEFVEELPAGYGTYLTKTLDDDGVFISGGQNQRLAIARAMYRSSPFLLLDEPTSALDPLAEDALMQLIKEQADGKTILYVSHRLSSIHIADKIIYVHNNTVEGFGRHDDVYRENESYREFYDAQAKHYKS
ncbi:MAG: ABC transporter ATP-binding protein/permease [Firmicutes bacterium]|nr:ABC transporter ATP-binding protein/permease [Bacillota bacterium]